jgi:hypothetical protein
VASSSFINENGRMFRLEKAVVEVVTFSSCKPVAHAVQAMELQLARDGWLDLIPEPDY